MRNILYLTTSGKVRMLYGLTTIDYQNSSHNTASTEDYEFKPVSTDRQLLLHECTIICLHKPMKERERKFIADKSGRVGT